ncbi:MAG: type II toxin-antitoxin system HigB family toxin [Bacteroidetes bacterium]|nr:type II toxin-antitoxin system HigB family toxin [Bacteroidota bacterium]MBU2584637.1 type II toxin-antitoxin system HigB family toxin [Bacteroidota bacterium]
MRIISRKRLKEFWSTYPDSEKALRAWFSICKKHSFDNFNDIKKIFPSADYFDDKVIFTIGGNKYRLIVKPQFKIKTFFIKAIYTHKEYDKGKWK